MSTEQESLSFEDELASDEKEDLFNLMEMFFRSLGIYLRRNNNMVFMHSDIEGAKRFVEHLLKSVDYLSSEMISIVEEAHPTLIERFIIELIGKTKLAELYKQLDLKVSGVFVVLDKKIKDLKFARKVSDYTISFPGSLNEIANLLAEFNFKAFKNSILGKITKSIIAYLLIKSNEFKFNNYEKKSTPVYIVIWSSRINNDFIENVEKVIRELA